VGGPDRALVLAAGGGSNGPASAGDDEDVPHALVEASRVAAEARSVGGDDGGGVYGRHGGHATRVDSPPWRRRRSQ